MICRFGLGFVDYKKRLGLTKRAGGFEFSCNHSPLEIDGNRPVDFVVKVYHGNFLDATNDFAHAPFKPHLSHLLALPPINFGEHREER